MSFRDSILGRYLATVQKAPAYDTFSTEYKLLRAYYSNDSNALRKNESAFEEGVSRGVSWENYFDSCVGLKPINSMNCLEGYRFEYYGPFCPYVDDLTIVRYKDSIVLNSLVSEVKWDENLCKVINHYSIKLDSATWADFEGRFYDVDFWGLRPVNGNAGLDGSTLKVYGFGKGNEGNWGPTMYRFVDRWEPARPLRDCFEWLLKKAKVDKGCLIIR